MKELKKDEKAKNNGGLIHVTDANFTDVLKNNAIALIDFFADWCCSCEDLAKDFNPYSYYY